MPCTAIHVPFGPAAGSYRSISEFDWLSLSAYR